MLSLIISPFITSHPVFQALYLAVTTVKRMVQRVNLLKKGQTGLKK